MRLGGLQAAAISIGLDRVWGVGRDPDFQSRAGEGLVGGDRETFFQQSAALGHRLDFPVADDTKRGLSEQLAGELALAADVTDAGDAEAEALLDADDNGTGYGDLHILRGNAGSAEHADKPVRKPSLRRGTAMAIAEFQMGMGVDQSGEQD
jgi:hypothetical protein